MVARRNKIAAVGGELLGAAMKLVGELVDAGNPPDENAVRQIRDGLAQCVERSDAGEVQLRLTLPGEQAVNDLATALAKLLVAGQSNDDSE